MHTCLLCVFCEYTQWISDHIFKHGTLLIVSDAGRVASTRPPPRRSPMNFLCTRLRSVSSAAPDRTRICNSRSPLTRESGSTRSPQRSTSRRRDSARDRIRMRRQRKVRRVFHCLHTVHHGDQLHVDRPHYCVSVLHGFDTLLATAALVRGRSDNLPRCYSSGT